MRLARVFVAAVRDTTDAGILHARVLMSDVIVSPISTVVAGCALCLSCLLMYIVCNLLLVADWRSVLVEAVLQDACYL